MTLTFIARAQPSPPPSADLGPPALSAVPPVPVALSDVSAHNPHADRVLFVPTAFTHPAGSYYFSNYDIAVFQAGYALTDRTQISVTFVPVLANESGLIPLDFSLKTVLHRSPHVRVAGQFSASGMTGIENIGTVLVGRTGGIVQLCWQAECNSSIVVSSNLVLIGVPLAWNGVGLIARPRDWIQLLVELDTALALSSFAGEANGVAMGGGIRFPWQRWALDLGVVRLVTQGERVFLPLVALTFRP